MRWWALHVLCLGVLLIVVDATIVAVALPSIVADLQLSSAAMTWTVNAYTLTFGGLLLLCGRLGDLYGPRRMFLIGIGTFVVASVACGIAPERTLLLCARIVQGLGAAMVTAVSLALIANLFPQPGERARAMAIYGFVCAAGGSLGELLGGALTSLFSWHSIFLVNVPIGIAVFLLAAQLLPRDERIQSRKSPDIGGAITISSALLLLTFCLVNGNAVGWTGIETQLNLALSAISLLLFIGIEARVAMPLVPLRLLRMRNLSVANFLGALWSVGTVAWFVIGALYLQRILHYDPLRVGLAFLPSTVLMGVFSAGLSASLTLRLGIRSLLSIGLLLVALGLAVFARAPLHGLFVPDVLPAMLMLGMGSGMASTPLLLAAMERVDSEESGLASGLFNTSFMMGTSLGLAVLVSIADARSAQLQTVGLNGEAALNSGYHYAFFVAALVTALASLLSALTLSRRAPDAMCSANQPTTRAA